MMNIPRWFILCGGLLLVNVMLVASSALQHLASAQTKTSDTAAESAEKATALGTVVPAAAPDSRNDQDRARGNTLPPAETDSADRSQQSRSDPADSAPSLREHPETPARGSRPPDPLALDSTELDNEPSALQFPPSSPLEDGSPNYEGNPVYQELKEMISNQTASQGLLSMEDDAAPPIPRFPSQPKARPSLPISPNDDYYSRLNSRLKTTAALCESARRIAAEAGAMARDGDRNGAREMLNMANQLREMAANLLIREL